MAVDLRVSGGEGSVRMRGNFEILLSKLPTVPSRLSPATCDLRGRIASSKVVLPLL